MAWLLADAQARGSRSSLARRANMLPGKVAVEDDVAVLIEDAKIHAPCMQIDAAIKSMGLAVETHGMVSLGWVEPEPGSW
jgi:hypothetical protein